MKGVGCLARSLRAVQAGALRRPARATAPRSDQHVRRKPLERGRERSIGEAARVRPPAGLSRASSQRGAEGWGRVRDDCREASWHPHLHPLPRGTHERERPPCNFITDTPPRLRSTWGSPFGVGILYSPVVPSPFGAGVAVCTGVPLILMAARQTLLSGSFALLPDLAENLEANLSETHAASN